MKKALAHALAAAGLLFMFAAPFAFSPLVASGQQGTTHVPSSTSTASGSTSASSQDINMAIHLQNPLKTDSLEVFATKVADGVVYLLTPFVVIMLVYAGFRFVAARGNEEQLQSAKQALLYTIIGAAIIIGAKGFSIIIKNTITKF